MIGVALPSSNFFQFQYLGTAGLIIEDVDDLPRCFCQGSVVTTPDCLRARLFLHTGRQVSLLGEPHFLFLESGTGRRERRAHPARHELLVKRSSRQLLGRGWPAKRRSINLKSIGTSPLSPASCSRYRPRVDKTSIHFYGVLKSCSWRMGTLPLYRESMGTAFVHRPAAWRCKCLAAQITCGVTSANLHRPSDTEPNRRTSCFESPLPRFPPNASCCAPYFLVSRPQCSLNCDFAVATNYECVLQTMSPERSYQAMTRLCDTRVRQATRPLKCITKAMCRTTEAELHLIVSWTWVVLSNLLFLVRQDLRRLHHGGVGPSGGRLFNDALPHMDTGNVTAYFPILCVAWFLVELFVAH